MHPLLGDLSEMTDAMVHEKYNDLAKRLNQASRLGYSDAIRQLQLLMSDYQAEINRRNEKMMAAIAEKHPEFKNIIDIG